MPNIAWLLERHKWERALEAANKTSLDLADTIARKEREIHHLRALNDELVEFAKECTLPPWPDSDLDGLLSWVRHRAAALLAKTTATTPESAPAAPHR